MPLIKRLVKGSPLTFAEGDANLDYLENLALNPATASFAQTASLALSGIGTFNGSFSGSFSGSGANLSNIPASAIVGLNLSQITSGSYSASISEAGLLVNNRVIAPSFTGSLQGTASWASNAISSSYASTASFAPSYLPLTGGTINGNVIVNGTASIAFLNVTYESASVIYSSGSNQFGDATNDIQTLIGTVIVSGSQQITGSLYAPSITGSLFGTASFAATASNILGGKATHVPFFITDTSLATSSIYQSGSTSVIINQDANTTANPEALYVWQPHPTSINVISGKGDVDNYLQLNIQNINQGDDASSDVVATANNGNETSNYIDMGINSETYNGFLGGPNDAYLYSTGNDLWIGNYSDGKNVYFFNSSSEDPLITLTPSNTVSIPVRLTAPNITGSLYGTASWARNAITASHAINAENASQASTASFVQQAQTSISASHAQNADYAIYAATAGNAANGGVTQIIAGSGISLIPSTGLGAVTVISSGTGGGISVISGSNVTQSFNNLSTWTFNHNLGVRVPVIQAFDSNYNQIIPQSITLTDTSSVIITFPVNKSGFAVASIGGVTGNAVSSSYSLFSTYADTASFAFETDPIFVAKSSSLATTGSNVFRGNQTITGSIFSTGSNTFIGNQTINGTTIITGSLIVSGSNTLTNIGPAIFSGSVTLVNGATGSLLGTASYSSNADLLDGRDSSIFATTGSNTFIGNQTVTGSLFTSGSNTLVGSTVLSGSISVSGSQTFNGTSAFYGNHTLSGSNTIVGNTYMSGSILVSGSSRFNNSEFIITGSTSVLGNFNVKGTSTFSDTTFTVTGSQLFSGSSHINGDQSVTGSLNVIGNINVVSGSSFTRWGNKLFNYAQFANTGSILVTANVSASFAFPLTYFNDGISITDNSKITFANTGLYNIQFSALVNQGTGVRDLHVWFKKTGSNIDNSDTLVTLQNNSQTLLAWNFAYPFSASEYVELWYHSNGANTSFPTNTAGSGFPAAPSIILTVTQIA